jgi:hypothetical protein
MSAKAALGIIALICILIGKLFNLRIENETKTYYSPRYAWVDEIFLDAKVLDSIHFSNKYKKNFSPKNLIDFQSKFSKINYLIKPKSEDEHSNKLTFTLLTTSDSSVCIDIIEKDSIIINFKILNCE